MFSEFLELICGEEFLSFVAQDLFIKYVILVQWFDVVKLCFGHAVKVDPTKYLLVPMLIKNPLRYIFNKNIYTKKVK